MGGRLKQSMESVATPVATLCHDYRELFADLGLAIFRFRLSYRAQLAGRIRQAGNPVIKS